MEKFLTDLASILWDWPTMVLLGVVGILFTVKTGFFQFRHFGFILKNTVGQLFIKDKRKNTGDGVMTPFQALATALSGTIGNANMSGVATAIVVGGPGAVFWMWACSLLGMISKVVEVALAVHFRQVDEKGNVYGGPMYYIEHGLGKKWKPLAYFFAFSMAIGALGTAVYVQPYTMSSAMDNIFGIPPIYTVVCATVLSALVIFGGFKSIGKFCEKITPLMSGVYIIGALGILIVNYAKIPEAFGLIFYYAFNPMAATGGLAGSTVALAMKRGIARGTFSNEAGMGSAPMVHATAQTDHPMRQGLYGAFEVFFDTLVICSMTALVILSCGTEIWQSGVNGIDLTIAAFSAVYGKLGGMLVGISVLLFAFSTMIGWCVEYETSMVYCFGSKFVTLFRIIYLIPPFFTLGKSVEMIWTVVDISTAIVVIPNVIALLMLSGVFMKIFKDFEENYIKPEIAAAKAKKIKA